MVEQDKGDENVTYINDYKKQLTQKNYNMSRLAEELLNKMNEAVGNPIMFGASVSEDTARITIDITGDRLKFYIFSDKDILTQVKGT